MKRFKFALLASAMAMTMALAACDDNGNDANRTAANQTPAAAPAGMEPATGDAVTGVPGVSEGADASVSSGPLAAPVPGEAVIPPTAEPPPCEYGSLVGRDLKDIDLNQFTGPTRVIHEGQPVTMDYRHDRVNLILEKDTDIIKDVTCG